MRQLKMQNFPIDEQFISTAMEFKITLREKSFSRLLHTNRQLIGLDIYVHDNRRMVMRELFSTSG